MAMLQPAGGAQVAATPRGNTTRSLAVAARANLSGAVVRPHPADHTADPFSRVSEFSMERRELKAVKLEPAPLDDSEYW